MLRETPPPPRKRERGATGCPSREREKRAMGSLFPCAGEPPYKAKRSLTQSFHARSTVVVAAAGAKGRKRGPATRERRGAVLRGPVLEMGLLIDAACRYLLIR